jgi:hypothetical protein
MPALYAQQVSGRIIDDEQHPVEFANVVWLALPDSSFVQGTVSDDTGVFTLDTQGREGVLRITSVGYSTIYNKGIGNVGNLMLRPDAQLLGEVVVKSTLPKTRVKGEALVTNVEGTVLEKAGTLQGLLDKIPNVSAEEGTVSVFGRGEAEIYINGRKMRDASELDQIAADNIKQVEVISHPGAQYDASVKAVVRITTKRTQGEGFGFSNRLASAFDGDHVSPSDQLNLNYRRGGLDLAGMLSYGIQHWVNRNELFITSHLDKLWTQDLYNRTKMRNENLQTTLSANYLFNPRQALGVRYDFSRSPSEHEYGGYEATVWQDGLLEEETYTDLSQYGDSYQHSLNAYYNGQISDWTIDLNLDGVWRTHDERTLTGQVVSTDALNTSLYATRLVLGHPLWQGTFRLGGEYDYTRRHDEALSSALLDTDTRVRENSQSAFVEYSRTFGKIQAQLGLRYERVGFDYYEDEVKQEAQCRTFRNLFPSFMLSGSFGVHQVQLGYRRDIARPSYRSLSTSVLYGNRYTLETGNPLLLPTLTDNINAVWSWRWVQVYADFQHIQDDVIKMFLNYQEEVKDESAISEATGIITPQNIRSYNVTNLSVSLSPTLGIWTPVLTTGLRKQWLTMETPSGPRTFRTPYLTQTFQNTFSLPHDFILGLYLNWATCGDRKNNIAHNARWRANLSLQKDWLQHRLSLHGEVVDLFKTWIRHYVTTDFMGTNRTVRNSGESYRYGRVTLTYKFNAARSKYRGTGAGESQKNRM